MKTCTNIKCQQANPQPLTNFSKEKSRKDGLQFHCKGCSRDYRALNKEKIAIRKTKYALENKDKIAKYMTEYHVHYHEDNRENILAKRKMYRDSHKEEVAADKLKWRKSRPGKYAAYCAKRRAQKALASPPWLTPEQYKEMESIYVEASRLTRETGIVHEVDHIEPLQGKKVKGLHVPWNLRVVPRLINRSKGNRSIS